MPEKEAWVYQLDWSNIIKILGLDKIEQIPEDKRIRVTKKLSKLYGSESMLSFNPQELDELVASELKNLMEKELRSHAKQKEKMEKQIKARMPSMKRPGVIPIDMNDIKDLPDEIKKMFSKMFMQNEGDDDNDDDSDKYNEDKNSYYI
ncbi:MAG: hypothetical protein KGD72_10035 [Candidatus Lokiarchaeota archaeon]|nr:hypothetical protein [Candidatus Lokiarchaeota archaeon]